MQRPSIMHPAWIVKVSVRGYSAGPDRWTGPKPAVFLWYASFDATCRECKKNLPCRHWGQSSPDNSGSKARESRRGRRWQE
ncbi:hypothetical protein An14g04580 [Aspergillus niger]|uniref:Uncharacterized protein n=2 Tax=Aspergillus niger TaxID=5061 RepID=A2R3K2_ASPNC|nr:hypothetical protein An14g04580 [Aspergillus niger]CAK42020.1 hypothetical protein An14g04580 [Aspergillus niger]